MSDLLTGKEIIDSSEDISALEQEHDHGHDHSADAHIWLSPDNAKQMVTNICEALCKQYPEHINTFKANRAALHLEIDALQTYAQQQLASLPTRELITFHDGFSYFAEAFDLHILAAVEEESGSEASAAELKDLIKLVRGHNLPAVFIERSGSVSAADIIAAETGVKIYTLDMAMSGDSWIDAMYHNIDTIKEALG